jgi:hypothetical protein
MKKIEKLKLSEMQDFTAIEKQESIALKGGIGASKWGWQGLVFNVNGGNSGAANLAYSGHGIDAFGSVTAGDGGAYYNGYVTAAGTYHLGSHDSKLYFKANGISTLTEVTWQHNWAGSDLWDDIIGRFYFDGSDHMIHY